MCCRSCPGTRWTGAWSCGRWSPRRSTRLHESSWSRPAGEGLSPHCLPAHPGTAGPLRCWPACMHRLGCLSAVLVMRWGVMGWTRHGKGIWRGDADVGLCMTCTSRVTDAAGWPQHPTSAAHETPPHRKLVSLASTPGSIHEGQLRGPVSWHARRRKGMSSDVSINAYFDDELLLQLARQDADLLGFM